METTKWLLDAAHSDLGFKIKHLMISNVKGQFKDFKVSASTSEGDFLNAGIEVEIETASVYTNNEQRDNHLRTGDFFETEKYPKMTFKSTGIQKLDEDSFELKGDFTIKEVTKPLKLNIEHSGVITDPQGNTKAGFSFFGKINRKDWGLTYNAALESGGVLLGEDVKIEGEIQLIKEKKEEFAIAN